MRISIDTYCIINDYFSFSSRAVYLKFTTECELAHTLNSNTYSNTYSNAYSNADSNAYSNADSNADSNTY